MICIRKKSRSLCYHEKHPSRITNHTRKHVSFHVEWSAYFIEEFMSSLEIEKSLILV